MASRWVGNAARCRSGAPRSTTSRRGRAPRVCADWRGYETGSLPAIAVRLVYSGRRQAADLQISLENQRVDTDQTGTSIKCRSRWLRAPATSPRSRFSLRWLAQISLERGAENTRRPRDWRMVAPNEVKQGREFESGCLRYEDESAGIRFSRYRKIPQR